jgi:hypothetical protein
MYMYQQCMCCFFYYMHMYKYMYLAARKRILKSTHKPKLHVFPGSETIISCPSCCGSARENTSVEQILRAIFTAQHRENID